MDDWVGYTVLGIALGSVYAIAAVGLVVTYATSGVFNFAHGAIATVSALVYWQLGEWGAHPAVAAVVTIAVFAPLVGAVLEITVMRALRSANEITSLVVPIAVTLALTGGATWIWYQRNEVHQNAYWFGGGNAVDVLGQPLRWHQVIGIACALSVAVAMHLVLRHTRLGLTMRAAVDDRRLLMMNGGRPDRVSMASWAVGSALAALAGVLLSPASGAIEPLALTVVVFSAYPAAVAGRLRSVPVAFGSAIALGLAVNWWTKLSNTPDGARWPALDNLRIALPAVLLFVVLVLLPQDRLQGVATRRPRPRAGVPPLRAAACWGGALVAVVAMVQSLLSDADVISFANGIGLSLMALSLVLLTGYARQINLAVYTFAGIATIAAWQVDVGPGGQATGSSLSVRAVLLGVTVCMLVGGLVALPALRLRGLYLGLATFAFAIVADQLVMKQGSTLRPDLFGLRFDLDLFTNRQLTVPRPHWFGVDFSDQRRYLMLLTVAFAAIGIALVALRRSAYGRLLVAVDDSPAACATLGIDVVRVKLSVFMLSAGLAGLGGLLWAAQVRTVSSTHFDPFAGLALFMVAVIGGIGYVSGALVAGLTLSVVSVVLPGIFDDLGERIPELHWLFSSGLARFGRYIGVALLGIGLARNPSGIAHAIAEHFAPLRRVPAAAAVWATGLTGLWLLTWRGAVDNWSFVIAVAASIALVPTIAMRVVPHRFAAELARRRRDDDHLDTLGLDRPLTVHDADRLDRHLRIRAGEVR